MKTIEELKNLSKDQDFSSTLKYLHKLTGAVFSYSKATDEIVTNWIDPAYTEGLQKKLAALQQEGILGYKLEKQEKMWKCKCTIIEYNPDLLYRAYEKLLATSTANYVDFIRKNSHEKIEAARRSGSPMYGRSSTGSGQEELSEEKDPKCNVM